MSESVSGKSKLALGVALPLGVFLLYHVLLLRSVDGKGEDLGFAGMGLYFQSFIILPLVFIANTLLMWRDWKSKVAVLLAGFIPPTAAAVYEFVLLYGHR